MARLHRRVWQRLPRRWRRRALFALAALLAPRPGPRPEPAAGPIYVAGALTTPSGLGESARLAITALEAAGYRVHGLDLSSALMQDETLGDGRYRAAAPAPGPGIVILHVSGFLMALAMLRLGRRFLRGKTIIGYWAWELPDLTEDWLGGLAFAHEIWVPSRFVAESVRRHTNLPVRIVPHPVPPQPEPAARDPERLTVLVVFDMRSSFARKNPLAAIEAFRRAFGTAEDRRLIVKLTGGSFYPPGREALLAAIEGLPNASLDERVMNGDEMAKLLDACDILLSLHRAEGFGLVLAEAMQRGKPVVATGWSGNTDFMTVENSCPVAYRLVPAIDPQGTYHHPAQCWADPDIEDAARQLRRLEGLAERRRIGARARQDASTCFALERYPIAFVEYLQLSNP